MSTVSKKHAVHHSFQSDNEDAFHPGNNLFPGFFSMTFHSFGCILPKSTLKETQADQRRGISYERIGIWKPCRGACPDSAGR